MFLHCCLWSLNSQLWEILDADGSNRLIFCCFCCMYKTEEDVVFTEGSTKSCCNVFCCRLTLGENREWVQADSRLKSNVQFYFSFLSASYFVLQFPPHLPSFLYTKPQVELPPSLAVSAISLMSKEQTEWAGTVEKAVATGLVSTWKLGSLLSTEAQ